MWLIEGVSFNFDLPFGGSFYVYLLFLFEMPFTQEKISEMTW